MKFLLKLIKRENSFYLKKQENMLKERMWSYFRQFLKKESWMMKIKKIFEGVAIVLVFLLIFLWGMITGAITIETIALLIRN